MFFLWKVFLTSLILSMIVGSLGQIFSYKSLSDEEKLSSFECGFLTKTNSWTPFSMHFFLSALIFLLFDVELVLLFPFIMENPMSTNIAALSTSLFFLVFLSFGFVLEWGQSFLEWTR